MKTKRLSGNLKLNQIGFSGIEILLSILAIIIVGLAGWYMYHANHKNTSSYSFSTQTNPPKNNSTAQKPITQLYADNSKTFTVEYPSTWAISEQQPGEAAAGLTLLDSKQVEFTPAGAPDVSTVKSAGATVANAIGILAFKSSDPKSLLATYFTGNVQTTPQNVTVNGYQAMYQQSISTTAPTYTDDVYAVTHNGATLLFDFREKQGTDSSGAVPAFNAVNTVPAFTALVKSVKFLN